MADTAVSSGSSGTAAPSVPLTPLQPPVTVPSVPVAPEGEETVLLRLFRTVFPEFGQERFADFTVSLHLRIAQSTVSRDAWGETWGYGVCLVAAHRLALGQDAANEDGSVNTSPDAAVASRSVGGVSVSYNATAGVSAMTDVIDAYWQSTSYGRQYVALCRLFGAGCICL